MAIEEKLKGLKKWELVTRARKLKETRYRRLNKKELIEYIKANYTEQEIKAIIDVKLPWWKRIRDFTHFYGIQTALSLFVGIIAIILAFIFFQSSKKSDAALNKRLDIILKKFENRDPLERDRLIKELKEKNEDLETALKDERAGNTKERKEAINALKKGNPTKAQELFKRRIEKDKVNLAENYLNLGNAYYVDLKFDEALESYNKSIENKPDYHEAWVSKGIALYDLSRYEEALQAYDKAIEIKPDYYQAWYNKGFTLTDLGRHDKALEAYNKAIEIKPDDQSVWNNKGDALRKLSRHEEALKAFDKAIEIKQDYHEALSYKGIALHHLGRHDEALEAYNKAIEIKPDDHDSWYNKWGVLVAMGRLKEAMKAYRKYNELKKNIKK